MNRSAVLLFLTLFVGTHQLQAATYNPKIPGKNIQKLVLELGPKLSPGAFSPAEPQAQTLATTPQGAAEPGKLIHPTTTRPQGPTQRRPATKNNGRRATPSQPASHSTTRSENLPKQDLTATDDHPTQTPLAPPTSTSSSPSPIQKPAEITTASSPTQDMPLSTLKQKNVYPNKNHKIFARLCMATGALTAGTVGALRWKSAHNAVMQHAEDEQRTLSWSEYFSAIIDYMKKEIADPQERTAYIICALGLACLGVGSVCEVL